MHGRKINGSKSRKCTLPHERLTKKERNAMNGEVKTYNVGKPMNWHTFKGMPLDLQKQYIRRLQLTFSANDAMLADMFGISRPTVALYRNRELGLPSLGKGNTPSAQEALAFERFVAGELPSSSEAWDSFNVENTNPATGEDNASDECIEAREKEDAAPAEAEVHNEGVQELRQLSFTAVTGDVADYLTRIGTVAGVLMPGAVHVYVTIEVGDGGDSK